MATWIDLEDMFSNRQGFGTTINIEECLHGENDIFLPNNIYQQLISDLNKYYKQTSEDIKLIIDVNKSQEENITNNTNKITTNTNDIKLLKEKDNQLVEKITKNENDIKELNTNFSIFEGATDDKFVELDEFDLLLNNRIKLYENNLAIVKNYSELISAVESNKKLIYMQEGNYTPTKELELTENTKIIGVGKVVINCNVTGITNIFRNKTLSNQGEYTADGNITIENIEFDGQNTTNNITVIGMAHSNNFKIENCKFYNYNTAWHCIEINSSKNVTIENCQFLNFGLGIARATEIVQVDGSFNNTVYPWNNVSYDSTMSTDIFIKNNLFENYGGVTGCIGTHTYVKGYKHSNINVEENTFKNVDNAIYLLEVETLKVINNYGKDVFNFMYLGSLAGNTQTNTIVRDNRIAFKDTVLKDLPIFYGELGRFIYMIYNKGQTNITVDNCFIENNVLWDTKDYAISVTGNNITVNGNKIYKGRMGVYLYGGDRIICTGNIVTDSDMETDIRVGGNESILTQRVICSGNIGAIETTLNVSSDTILIEKNITN